MSGRRNGGRRVRSRRQFTSAFWILIYRMGIDRYQGIKTIEI
jgi:hypothetical protein